MTFLERDLEREAGREKELRGKERRRGKGAAY